MKRTTKRVYNLMKCRCLDQECKDYNTKIVVCDEWLNIKNFLRDMGEKPKGKTLDRKNLRKGYYKENCYWATREEKMQNRTNQHLIKIKSLE